MPRILPELYNLGYSPVVEPRKGTAGTGQNNRSRVMRLLESVYAFPDDGRFSAERATLDDQSSITATAGVVTPGAGLVTVGASSTVTFGGTGPYNGNLWVLTNITMPVSGSGAYRPRFLTALYSPEGLRNRPGQHVWKFPENIGSADLQFQSGAGFLGDLLDIQVYDMAATLAQPADVYIAAGQSNMAATVCGLGLDITQDGWPDKRCLYFPGSAQAAHGAVLGQPHACVAPLMSNGAALGVSPAHGFAKQIVRTTPTNRNVVIIQTAQGGTGLLASNAEWNSRGSNPVSYNNCVTLVNQAMAALPVGSAIKGFLWAQGEADSGLDMTTYPGAFAVMRSDLETAVGSGQVPWMFILPPPDAPRANQALLIDTQLKMDAASGHPYSQIKVHTVARGPGFMEDDTHANAAGNRSVGRAAAIKYRMLGY